MRSDLRYTGCWPPLNVLAEHPNWVYALEEEGVEGQDETTIRPEDQQVYISEETCFTAADVTFSDGSRKTAILRLEEGEPESADVFDESDWWTIVRELGNKWVSPLENWLPEEERRPHISLKNSRIFPMAIRSRLRRADDKQLVLIVRPEGSGEFKWER